MKRLYNEYSAPSFEDNVIKIEKIMHEAFQKVWLVVIEDNICPRDAESFCHSTLSCDFGQNILMKAMAKRKIERKRKT
jgi:hypothetical protein